MIVVRDKSLPKSDYKGRSCYAVDAVCPCRPCYNCHDCTPPNRTYSRRLYSDVFHCASNYNSGCPQPKPVPVHNLNRLGRCRRCGVYVQGGGSAKHED